MNSQNNKNIIAEYKKWQAINPDKWIEHCIDQNNIQDSIIYAALSEDILGKRNPHQRRLKKENLERFASNLIDNIIEIQNSKTFDELLKVIENCKVKGVGVLACYDTATRIGAKLDLFPEVIYLHAGTKIGAQKLLGKRLRQKYLRIDELPKEFQKSSLTPFDIENILCISKDKF
jgi:hypothetical protein